MDKDKFKTMMHRAQKGPVSELNGCITCKLCKGYFIDATTIIECLHTFCRSCIVRYLESNKYCPICDVQVHKTKPLLNIRRDKTIQDLVYKLVPRLYQNEVKRRKVFYEEHTEAKPSLSEESTASQYEYLLAPDESINLILNYYGCSTAPRYLRCPSAVSISHLKKLIQAKYELTDHHKVDVFYNQDTLNPCLTLMDVMYIYSWNKKEPLDLAYKIYECRAKKPKLDCTEDDENNINKSSNNNNWKEVQLRISETGEMSITGIQDASMLELLDATEKFKSEIVINESKNMDNYPKPVQVDTDIGNNEVSIQATHTIDTHSKPLEESSKGDVANDSAMQQSPENHVLAKKELPELKLIGKTLAGDSSTSNNTKSVANAKLLNSGIKMVINNAKSGAGVTKITTHINSDKKQSTSPINIAISSNNAGTSRTVPSAIINKACIAKPSLAEARTLKGLDPNETLKLNNELSVIPLNPSTSCVSLSSCGGTTTVFSTISKSMCSTKSDDSYTCNSGMIERNESKTTADLEKQFHVNSVSKESNNLKRKCEGTDKTAEVPVKLPKPTILNHSIGLMNLSNNHPLKKHSKMNRNGERKIPEIGDKIPSSSPNLTVSHVLVSQKPISQDNTSSKPVIINKNLSYLQLSRCSTPKSTNQKSPHLGNLPCYMPKMNLNSIGSKNNEKNVEKFDISQEKFEGSISIHSTVPRLSVSHSHSHTYQHSHHPPIITPAQLPHHQNLNSLQLKQSSTSNTKETMDKLDHENAHTITVSQASISIKSTTGGSQSNGQTTLTIGSGKSTHKPSDFNSESLQQIVTRSVAQGGDGVATTSATSTAVANNSLSTTIKAKPSTPIGYKTLRDPPKSWNSQINSQIARVNQNVKAQQLANAAAVAGAGGNAQGRYGGDLKSIRPAKFFKGRNMPRYLGNPASGVKPMYQVDVSPDKKKNQEQQQQHTQNVKAEKSEIKKHSIVKIDPKTLKPISEKAPETSNLSNMSSNLGLGTPQNNQELRINAMSGDLKINTSSVSIFNPLKLQQNSPKNERKSPKSPHSPKVKTSASTSAAVGTSSSPTSTVSTASPINALSPKQQRDKTSLTFTPPNPFVPNLASQTLNPNQFLYPAGGFPSYDPRFMAACHSLWYTQRMAAAAAAGLVPPPLPHAFGLNMGLNSATTIGQQSPSPGVSPKHSTTSTKSSGQASPRTNSATTMLSKSSPTSSNKKMKESSACKSEKSLETAVEKLTQSKAKELGSSVANKAMECSKDVRNGSPLSSVQTASPPKEIWANNNSERDQNYSSQQKKTASKGVTGNGGKVSVLEKLSQNKAIEILDGKRSSSVQGGRSSPMSSNKLLLTESRLTAEKDIVSGGSCKFPLSHQSTNLNKCEKSQSKNRNDGEHPNGSPSSTVDGPKKSLLENKQIIPDPKRPTPEDKEEIGRATPTKSTEIEKRLAQPESNSGNQEKGSEPDGSSIAHTNDTGKEDTSSKGATPSDKLVQEKSDPEQKPCSLNQYSEHSGELTGITTSDIDTSKNDDSESNKCGNIDSHKQPLPAGANTDKAVNATLVSGLVGENTNGSPTETIEDKSSVSVTEEKDSVEQTSGNITEKVVCSKSDSGGGEKTNSV